MYSETRTMLVSLKEANAVASMMRAYGGSFIAQIGRALELADQDNIEKIKIAFREEWDTYLEFSKMPPRA